MLLLAFIPLYALAYIVLAAITTQFFRASWPRFSSAASVTIIVIALVTALITIGVELSSNAWLMNRIQHCVGGGMLSMFLLYRIMREQKIHATRFQFFFFSFCTVTSLGVANEIAEFFIQSFTHLVFAPTIDDTWLDLVSNTVGALIAGAVGAWRWRVLP